MTESPCVELARFDLQSQHSPNELIAASDRLQREFLSSCPGFLKRELLHLDGSSYLDLVHWKTADAAQAAMATFAQSPAALAYFSLMEPNTPTPLHGTPLVMYP
jgi:hypothetical protein